MFVLFTSGITRCKERIFVLLWPMPIISEQKRDARRTQILNAARRCFQREGLHATTMPDVIQASGLSTGAVYTYFKNKEEIIQAALMASMLELSDLLRPILRGDPPPAPGALLCQITEAIVRFSARDGFDLKRLALLGWSEAQRNDRLRASMGTFYLTFRNDLADVAKGWQRTGMIDSSADPEDMAKALLALVLGFVVQAAIIGEVEPEMISRGLSWLGGGKEPSSQTLRT
jgi:TetR/AcrR family transcriptional regulator, transcriptional repressor of aconitase